MLVGQRLFHLKQSINPEGCCRQHVLWCRQSAALCLTSVKGPSNNGAFGFVGAGGGRQARLRCWSAFAAAFALPSGRLATPWTQLGRQVAAIRSRLTIRRML
ncbi:MAG: hypothetical protein GY877_07320 [Hyphomicrobium sp.]|nr:hypothetical protein [Hyphomicrobium sp.]